MPFLRANPVQIFLPRAQRTFPFLTMIALCALTFSVHAEESKAVKKKVSDNWYEGELVRYPGPWSFQIPRDSIIIVRDQELIDLANDPDKELNLALSHRPRMRSLRQICEQAQRRGARTVVLAFDQFFAQYRPGLNRPRELTPDKDDYIALVAKISKFMEAYGLGLELSLLSPLEVGPAYRQQTGESGVWMHYRKGLRDPQTGAFSVQLWRQRRWCNNKGFVEVEDAGVRVFAFKERRIGGTPYRVVDPKSIVEISDVAKVQVFPNLKTGVAQRIRVYGRGRTDVGDLDRVLVVQMYHTPEMDYFSDSALPFLKKLVDRYVDAGVRLNALYSDEMHILQDWAYHSHHDHGEFALRYVSPGLERKFAAAYGEEYKDFAKYLVYFLHGQEDAAPDLTAKQEISYVFGPTPEDVWRTALFRSRYYQMLQNGVVDLFVAAKKYAEERVGHRLGTRAHATWAESPTCDYWETWRRHRQAYQYEYTSDFVWSNTVHQAASACYDYFKWGEFLDGGNTDHPEGGWIDRDYYGLALACSLGVINEIPYSYCAHWGMPAEISARRAIPQSVYNAGGSPLMGMVADMAHRDVSVLMLYPLDLVAADEQFGSVMTQYGYANYITQAKLLELGEVRDGAIEICGRRYTTLVTLFEPFPSARLLRMMGRLAESGGRVIWSGPPPILTAEGKPALRSWEKLFGVAFKPHPMLGLTAPGMIVQFEGALKDVRPQVILTDFIVDWIYPIEPGKDAQPVARVKNWIVGAERKLAGGGSLTFLGFRPRDDQAASLGYETRTWFEILDRLGAYPPTGVFPGTNDNTEYLSRTTDYLCCRFPNGAVAIGRHFRHAEEGWPGGFARNRKEDLAYLKKHPLPPDDLHLRDFRVNGHTVRFDGRAMLAFRVDKQGNLVAFCGAGGSEITIDGRRFVYADRQIAQLAWAPVPAQRRKPGGAILQIMVYSDGEIRIPAVDLPANVALFAQGQKPGSRGVQIDSRIEKGCLVFRVDRKCRGRWLYVVPAQ